MHCRCDLVGRRAGSEAAHTGVDLQVITNRNFSAVCELIQVAQVFERVNDRREIVLQHREAIDEERFRQALGRRGLELSLLKNPAVSVPSSGRPS